MATPARRLSEARIRSGRKQVSNALFYCATSHPGCRVFKAWSPLRPVLPRPLQESGRLPKSRHRDVTCGDPYRVVAAKPDLPLVVLPDKGLEWQVDARRSLALQQGRSAVRIAEEKNSVGRKVWPTVVAHVAWSMRAKSLSPRFWTAASRREAVSAVECRPRNCTSPSAAWAATEQRITRAAAANWRIRIGMIFQRE